MTDRPQHERPGDDPSEDIIQRLLSQAGERRKAPADMKRAVRANVHAAWRQHLEAEQANEPNTPASGYSGKYLLAAAACLVVGMAFLLFQFIPGQNETAVATVARLQGEVWYNLGADDWQLLSTGQALYADTRLRTGAAAGTALAIGNTSVRAAENSEFVILSPTQLDLQRGALYLDTGRHSALNRGPALVIETAHGQATDIGTQFIVRSTADKMSVSVREGLVHVHSPNGDSAASAPVTTRAGEKTSLLHNGEVVQEKLAADTMEWDWAIAMAPAFKLENASLKAFLLWASRELGKPLIFESPLVEQQCEQTILHGQIGSLGVSEALVAVLETTRFHLDPDRQDVIHILTR